MAHLKVFDINLAVDYMNSTADLLQTSSDEVICCFLTTAFLMISDVLSPTFVVTQQLAFGKQICLKLEESTDKMQLFLQCLIGYPQIV
jgi:hypothetical protein